MICAGCQKSLPDEALYCSSCGTSTATKQFNREPTSPNAGVTHPHEKRTSEPHSDQRVGLILDSKYQLLEVLGQGGMGAVYLARRLHIGDEVAVKLLSPDLLRDEQAVERFRREARAAAMIRHPNVVSIHDFSDAVSVEASKEAYLVMELVKGVSLRTILQSEGHLSPSRAVAIMRDICAGVGAAHRQGLLHRDLKPDNVIITSPADQGERESAKVVDFGLAKVYEEGVSPLTKAGVLVGTLIYMAPEQCRGEQLDARADVYSLGAMLYEMLSGQPPFIANTLTGLITKHLNDVPSPFDRALHIPFHLEQSCLRALAKSPADRQADAVVLGKELQAALDGATDPLAQQPTIAFTSAPARKSNLWKWIVAFVLVTALGVTLLAVGVAIKLWLDKSSTDDQSTSTTSVEQKTNPDRENKTPSTATTKADLRGTWNGTYGVLNQPARLIITRHEGDTFEGVVEQKTVRVAFKGSINSDKIHMKQTKVLQGEGWDLGEDSGTISDDGNRIFGTGTDTMSGVLGISYNWSFSRSNQ